MSHSMTWGPIREHATRPAAGEKEGSVEGRSRSRQNRCKATTELCLARSCLLAVKARELLCDRTFSAVSVMAMDCCLGLVDSIPDAVCREFEASFPGLKSVSDNVHVCYVQEESDTQRFKVAFRLPFRTQEETMKFIGASTKNTWRTQKTNPSRMSAGTKNIFWAQFRCQSSNIRVKNSTRKPHPKHTRCSASITVTVKHIPLRCRSKDPHMPNFPTILVMENRHNHRLHCAEALSLKDVSAETREKFVQLLEKGHSPASALDMHKHDLHIEYGDQYYEVAADRSLCPDKQWCYRLYYSLFNEAYGNEKHDITKNIEKQMSEINSKCDLPLVRMENVQGQLVVVVCTPLMHRVHTLLPQSGEIVFMDSSGGIERYGHRIFIVLTHSCAGGLPLGIMITSSESQASIHAGLETLKDMVGDTGFYNRGHLGPQVFMTDDSIAEQNAIEACFPSSKSLLCTFHILQAAWRWLWHGKNAVPHNERASLFYGVKALVYARTENDLEEEFSKVLANEFVKKHDKFQMYLSKLWDRRSKWAIALRKELPIRGNHTNNFCEAAVRVLKDKIMNRVKAFNVVQLIDFVTSRLDCYYEKKLLHAAGNRSLQTVRSRFIPAKEKTEVLQVVKESDDMYCVNNTETGGVYHVNTTIGSCTCPVGMDGSFCKHQSCVTTKHNVRSLNMVEKCDIATRKLLHEIATGNVDVLPEDWYASFTYDAPAVSDSLLFPVQENGRNIEESNTHGSAAVGDDTDGGNNENESSDLKKSWLAFSDLILQKLEEQPEVYCPAVSKFLENMAHKKTDGALSSALYTSGGRERSSKISNQMTVQPTAVARRVSKLGGRLCLQSGRPPKCSIAGEHSENRKIKETLQSQVLPSRKKAAPHDLSCCVKEMKSLGKSH